MKRIKLQFISQMDFQLISDQLYPILKQIIHGIDHLH